MIGYKIEFTHNQNDRTKTAVLQGTVIDKVRNSFSINNFPNYDVYIVELDNSEVRVVHPSSILRIIKH